MNTLGQLLERAADHPDAGLRLLDRRERASLLTWQEIHYRALGVAGRLHSAGIAAGDRVVLIFPTGADFFYAFFGILAAGAVPVPLYPPVRLGRLAEYHQRTARLIKASGARLVLADGRVRRILGETIERARPPLGCRVLDDLPTAAPRHEVAGGDGEDLALVQFSSGTTVDPKPVALSHRAVLAQTRALNSFWPEQHHTGVSWLPLYHDMGLIGCVFPALERPATLTLLPPEAFVVRPALWLRAVSRYRATISPAPNFAYGLCLAKIRDDELDGVDLSCWQVALNGAEAVAPRVLRAFRQRFARWGFRAEALTPVYGLSEAALAVTFSRLDATFTSATFDRERLAGEGRAVLAQAGLELPSLGRPLPGFEIRILPPQATSPQAPPCADGEVGKLWVRGPSLMSGYLDRPEATAESLVDGWLDTGDLGFLRDGELYLTGRAKDLIVLRGRNYAPEEIEQALHDLPGLRTGCAVAVGWLPEGEEREILILLVETARDTHPEDLEALPRRCRESVLGATGLKPDRVVLIPPGTLPRTTSGKLRRQEALRRYLADELDAPQPVSGLRMLGALARSGLAFARARAAGPPPEADES